MFQTKIGLRHIGWWMIIMIISGMMLACIFPLFLGIGKNIERAPAITELPNTIPSTATQPTAIRPTATRQATPLPTQAPAVIEDDAQVEVFDYIYEQDFSSVPPDWDLTKIQNGDVEVDFAVQNGLFSWAVHAVTDNIVMNKPDPTVFLPEDGFLITVATQIQAQSSPTASGIMFRFQDFENFYYAKLSESGEVSAYALQNNHWNKLAGPVKSDHFFSEKLNRLTVVANNGQYELQLNDYPALQFADDRFLGGSAGLIIEINTGMTDTFLFDDFMVMKTGASAAQADEEEFTIPEEGGAVGKFEGEIKGVNYTIDYPATFIPGTDNDIDYLCLEKDNHLCVRISRPEGLWENPQAMADEVMGSFGKQVTNLDIWHQQHTTTIDGFSAYWVGCTYTQGGVDYKSSRLFVMVQLVAFEIDGYGEPEMMNQYEPIIKKMMESFSIVYN